MEVMVAVSIFTIVMTLGISSLLAVNNTNAQSRADREALDRVSYLLEHLTRKIRTASEVITPDGITSEILFTNQFGDTEKYSFAPAVDGGELLYEYTDYDDTGILTNVEKYNLTPEDRDLVQLSDVSFSIAGNDPADGVQPSVRMIIRGVVPDRRQRSEFSVQTTISLRLLQFQDLTI